MKVHEIMTAHARCVAPDTTLVEAAGLMRQLDVGALPVCDHGELTGMITDRDIVVRGVADGLDPTTARVSDVMSGAVEAIPADEDVEIAVRIMERRQLRRLPVLDGAKRLVGVVSLGDVATSSSPAFSGVVLRDVSQPHEASARRRRLGRQSEPPAIRPPAATGRSGDNEANAEPTHRRRSTRRRAAGRTTRRGSSSRRSSAKSKKSSRR